ncbi:DUF2892 domain-containing protein [Oleiharenicola sp. Vm1]|uniref:YgaP family membrane protein n=1 Tax=Oleiharenicola sp. Vm1 TaxID=3398393 RepID=UPI0039F5DCDA
MKTNVGFIDRVIRVILGCALLGAGYYFHSWWGLVGLLPLLTAAFGFCPAYLPLGLNTCGTKAKE